MFDKETLKIVKLLQDARLSLMKKQPFYAVLLLHMQFSLDPMCETAYTDGIRIAFCPEFLASLSDKELEFVLMHEVLHAALNHCNRKLESYDFDDFNTACDIVVNSNILFSNNMDPSSITLKEFGECMHITPDGREGYLCTAEEVYEIIRKSKEKKKNKNKDQKGTDGNDYSGEQDDGYGDPTRADGGFDDHTYWGGDDTSADGVSEMQEIWVQRMIEAITITNQISIRESHKGYGGPPLMVQRLLKELTRPQTDWKEILQNFVQEEVKDYSFNPPDRRFQDSIFLLPDFNEKEARINNIWFLIDTSGSIGDKALCAAYSEICSAIEQYEGMLEGMLSFTECFVTDPIPFSSVEDIMKIKPVGGGGNNFSEIFRYMNKNMSDHLPTFIIIITDGYDTYPDEREACGIPVLWLINNENASPPWGKVARIKIDE